MEKLKCLNCGNGRSFYRNISIQAKLKVNNKGEDLETIYEVDKCNIDNYFEPIYCSKCGEVVVEWEG
ncbi:hypothetical protein [uncultured Clostridium sp.]|uniref:hypothetical protein n=1 Tax=uncultured Clostridium sp. TaxID=59620 RepID=UPI00321738A6